MKNIICSLFIFTGISLFGNVLPVSYTITMSAEDKSLKKTEAAFEFTFYDSRSQLIKDEITFSHNSENKKQKANINGKIIEQVKPGKYAYQFFYNLLYLEITTDSILIRPGYRTEISVYFQPAEETWPVKKPVIYIYPTKTENVSIKLNVNGKLGFTYPEYKNGWNFVAEPGGVIKMNEKKYNYLFWDAELNINTATLNLNEGFIVTKNNLVNFFEEKLKLMGLNSQETQDYITYWCPLMNVNETNYIQFIFNEEFGKYAPLTINPKPNHLFRVCMLWSKANENTIVKEQKIQSFTRSGFTVVEWGGTEIKNSIQAQEL